MRLQRRRGGRVAAVACLAALAFAAPVIARTITGGFVALKLAFQKLIDRKLIDTMPLTGSIAAVSVGMIDGRPLCDLDYSEDSRAEVDANVVMTGEGGLVEVQATAERTPLSRASLDDLLGLAEGGIARLREVQDRVAP